MPERLHQEDHHPHSKQHRREWSLCQRFSTQKQQRCHQQLYQKAWNSQLGERIVTECVDENTWPKIRLSKSGGGKGVRGHSVVRRKGTWFCLVVPDKSGLRMVQLLDDTSHARHHHTLYT